MPLEWFRLSGTASRLETFTWQVALFLVAGGVWLLEGLPGQPWLMLRILAYAALAIAWLAAVTSLVRRMHDAGRTGWWILLAVVPGVNLVLVIYFLLAKPKGSNLNRWSPRFAYGLGFVLLASLAGLIFLRAFWAPFWIPAGSMKPALLVGDYIVVARATTYTPERGDVVVFDRPSGDQTYVKRVVGIPGDRLQMKDGALVLNGETVPAEPAGTFAEIFEPQGAAHVIPRCQNGPVGAGGTCRKQMLTETLPGGRSYVTLNINDSFADNTAEFTVPEGTIFVLGDNRDNSLDSRFAPGVGGVGFVPVANVVGEVRTVLFSWSGRAPYEVWTWREDRYFKEVE